MSVIMSQYEQVSVKNTFLTIQSKDAVCLRQTQSLGDLSAILLQSQCAPDSPNAESHIESSCCEKENSDRLSISMASISTACDSTCHSDRSCVLSCCEEDFEETETVEEKKARIAHEHSCGECRPCSFQSFWKQGCSLDNCDFCHEEHTVKYIRKAFRKNRSAARAKGDNQQ